MTTYVLRDGKLVPKHLAAPRAATGVHLISDTMQPMRHPVTGKLMDSKSQFRRVTRAAGCVEVGSDWQRPVARPLLDIPGLKADIAGAIKELGG